MFERPSSFHHTDRGAHKNSGACTAKLDTVELQMAKTTHNQTTKHPGLEQQEERGREAIVADLELTEDHEEVMEAHPVQVNLTVSLVVMLRVRCARHIMCLRTLLSRRWQPHHVACTIDV